MPSELPKVAMSSVAVDCQEWRYENIEQLRDAIHKWIKYYNEERIVVALKNSPLKYKFQLLQSNV